MTSGERVSRVSRSSDSYGRTDGLTEIVTTDSDQSCTFVPRASKSDGSRGEEGVRCAPPVADCIHEMAPGTCSDCSGRDGGETAEKGRHLDLLLHHRCIAAAWSSTCASCGEPYTAGTPIKRSPTGWVAPCCIDEHGRPTR